MRPLKGRQVTEEHGVARAISDVSQTRRGPIEPSLERHGLRSLSMHREISLQQAQAYFVTVDCGYIVFAIHVGTFTRRGRQSGLRGFSARVGGVKQRMES